MEGSVIDWSLADKCVWLQIENKNMGGTAIEVICIILPSISTIKNVAINLLPHPSCLELIKSHVGAQEQQGRLALVCLQRLGCFLQTDIKKKKKETNYSTILLFGARAELREHMSVGRWMHPSSQTDNLFGAKLRWSTSRTILVASGGISLSFLLNPFPFRTHSRAPHLLDPDRQVKYSFINRKHIVDIQSDRARMLLVQVSHLTRQSALFLQHLHTEFNSLWQHPTKCSVSIHPYHHLPLGGTWRWCYSLLLQNCTHTPEPWGRNRR